MANSHRRNSLVTTAGVSLSLGQGVRLLIDQGFVAGSPEALTQTLLLFLVLVTLLALGTFLRFYWFPGWENVSVQIYARLSFDICYSYTQAFLKPISVEKSRHGLQPTLRFCKQ